MADYVAVNGVSQEVINELRAKYEGRYFTYCIEDDINSGSPVVEREQFAIYLVNSQDHCSVLTNNCSSASGYAIAEFVE